MKWRVDVYLVKRQVSLAESMLKGPTCSSSTKPATPMMSDQAGCQKVSWLGEHCKFHFRGVKCMQSTEI
jgi:hypothetical protein